MFGILLQQHITFGCHIQGKSADVLKFVAILAKTPLKWFDEKTIDLYELLNQVKYQLEMDYLIITLLNYHAQTPTFMGSHDQTPTFMGSHDQT